MCNHHKSHIWYYCLCHGLSFVKFYFLSCALAHAFSFIHCQILKRKKPSCTSSYVSSTSLLIYLIKSNHPKDGRKAEWIIPCCLPGVSPAVVSFPPHCNMATGVWLYQQTSGWQSVMKMKWKHVQPVAPFWLLFYPCFHNMRFGVCSVNNNLKCCSFCFVVAWWYFTLFNTRRTKVTILLLVCIHFGFFLLNMMSSSTTVSVYFDNHTNSLVFLCVWHKVLEYTNQSANSVDYHRSWFQQSDRWMDEWIDRQNSVFI